MLYVTTGANGACKTLFTLKDVRELQLKENRPVYYSGFDMVADFGWTKLDFKDWQSTPDGSIHFVDECQNDMPVRPNASQVPPHINALSEHRKHGKDFYLITQHPQNIDLFVRRLVGTPGWHRHFKRAPGVDMVSQLQWAAVNGQCEKPGSGDSGQVTMRAMPKEVYPWYKSASLHTGKTKLPRAVYVLVACLLTVPVLGFLAYKHFAAGPVQLVKAKPGVEAVAAAPGARPGRSAGPIGAVGTQSDYFEARVPRIPGLPHTAPVYDSLTAVASIPYPAACVSSKSGCHCYTVQATPLDVSAAMCNQIARQGYFMEWHQAGGSGPAGGVAPGATSVPPAAVVAAPSRPAADPARPAASAAAASFAPVYFPPVVRAPDLVPDPEAVHVGRQVALMRAGSNANP